MKLEAGIYTKEDFSNAIFENRELSGVRFIRCNLKGADFTDTGVLYRCAFDTCNLSGARINGVEFRECGFLSCKFRGASFFATTFRECKMTGSDFTEAQCDMAEIIGGDWSYTSLRYLNFEKQDLSGVDFRGADLSGCRFAHCKLRNCGFQEASVHDTSFYGSDLRGASLDNLELEGTNLKNAKLDLQQCVLIAETLTEAKYAPERKGE